MIKLINSSEGRTMRLPYFILAASVLGGCDVLTFWREGETARVDMEDLPQFRNCRIQR